MSPVQPFHQNRIVNVGVGNPDVVADVDFVRLRRPDPALTAGALQAAAVTGSEGPVASLAGSPLETFLGSSALAPVVNPVTTFEQWLAQAYGPAQLATPALTDPQADPDADGFANALEFAFGLDPATGNDGSRAPRAEVSSGQLRLSYRRPVGGVPGVTYTVETRTTELTSDGLGWTTAALGADYTIQTSAHGDGTETVTVIFSSPVGTRQFGRIAVSF